MGDSLTVFPTFCFGDRSLPFYLSGLSKSLTSLHVYVWLLLLISSASLKALLLSVLATSLPSLSENPLVCSSDGLCEPTGSSVRRRLGVHGR